MNVFGKPAARRVKRSKMSNLTPRSWCRNASHGVAEGGMCNRWRSYVQYPHVTQIAANSGGKKGENMHNHTVRLLVVGAGVALFAVLAPAPDLGPLNGHGDAAHAQTRPAAKAQRATPRKIQKIPQLQVEVPGGPDKKTYGPDLVVYTPQLVNLRWGMPVSAASARWEIAGAPFPDGDVLKSGTVTGTPGADRWGFFTIDLAGVLPVVAPPADQPKKYYIRVFPEGEGLVASQVATVTHREAPEPPRFTAAGLYPELFRPMPIYVDLHRFNIGKADEENDEEPYIIPIVVYFDGTTVKALDIDEWTVRVQTSQRQNTHGNIPQYNSSIGSGDSIAIPPDVGYFEQDILPVSLDLADDQFFSQVLGFDVDYTHLTRATTVFVLLLAMEEDATSTEAANAARDATVRGLKDELNKCIQSLELADVIRLIKTGSNVQAVLTSDDANLCGYTAAEDSTVLDQIRAKLKDLAEDAATAAEIDEAKNWLPGGGLFLLNQIADHDDVIGFAFRSFTYAQIMNASGRIPFTFTINKTPSPEGVPDVIYTIEGTIGRCVHAPGRSRCVPQTKPLLQNR